MKNLGFFGYPNYAVTRCGKVMNITTGRELKHALTGLKRCQYPTVRLYRDGGAKNVRVHRLVALAFIDNPGNLPCVNHKDGNKLNPHYSNLEWCTYSENTHHAYRTGLHTWNVMTDELAHVCCEMFQQGMKIKEVAEAAGVEYHNAHDLLTGRAFGHVSEEYDLSAVPRRQKLSVDKVIRICEMLQRHLPIREIAEEVNTSEKNVRNIRLGKRHSNISKNYCW
jgi:hypothetical protein